MSWLTNFIRPKINAIVGGEGLTSNSVEELWHKCAGCADLIFHRDLINNQHVCPKCDKNLRMPLLHRMEALFDLGEYKRVNLESCVVDPLKFRDNKRYVDRLRDARAKTGEQDAVFVGYGTIESHEVVVFAMDFSFMGGSMGMAVGRGFLAAVKLAVAQKSPLIAVTASGGARMQEGILALMQMPSTVAACEELRDAGLPYIVICTDPTYGGVTASFAMLGDIHIAEPGALIGFAGRRVIEQTVREKLPDNFQTAEYLCENGMIDMVVPRKEMRAKLGILFSHILQNQNKVTIFSNDVQKLESSLVELPLAAD